MYRLEALAQWGDWERVNKFGLLTDGCMAHSISRAVETETGPPAFDSLVHLIMGYCID